MCEGTTSVFLGLIPLVARTRGGVGGLTALAREAFDLGTTLPCGVFATLQGAPFACFQAERCRVRSSRSPSGRLEDLITIFSDLITFSGQKGAEAGSMALPEGW